MGGCGSQLDCRVIMQPNLDWGIIVNFWTIPCIASIEATICLCFAEGALLDHQTTLDNLVGGMKSGCFAIRIWDISSGGAELVWCTPLVGVENLHSQAWRSPNGWGWYQSWQARLGEYEVFVHHQRTIWPISDKGLYTTLDVVWAKLEFVMMSHTGVGQRTDALIIGDDFCGALFLCARMISPTRLPRVMGYAGNMPKRNIYFGFLYGDDTMKTKSCKWRHLNLLYRQGILFNDSR